MSIIAKLRLHQELRWRAASSKSAMPCAAALRPEVLIILGVDPQIRRARSPAEFCVRLGKALRLARHTSKVERIAARAAGKIHVSHQARRLSGGIGGTGQASH